jgi:hypothetical protein
MESDTIHWHPRLLKYSLCIVLIIGFAGVFSLLSGIIVERYVVQKDIPSNSILCSSPNSFLEILYYILHHFIYQLEIMLTQNSSSSSYYILASTVRTLKLIGTILLCIGIPLLIITLLLINRREEV